LIFFCNSTWNRKWKHSTIHLYIYTYIYIHMYMYTNIHIHIYTYTYTYTYTHIHIHICICNVARHWGRKMGTYTHTYTYTLTHIHIYIYNMCVSNVAIYIYIKLWMCANWMCANYIYIYNMCVSNVASQGARKMGTHTYTYTYTCTHIHIYVYIYIYICVTLPASEPGRLETSRGNHTQTHTYIHTYTHTHTHPWIVANKDMRDVPTPRVFGYAWEVFKANNIRNSYGLCLTYLVAEQPPSPHLAEI